MKLHELTAAPARRARRVGRGIAAGQGKTAGRGTKGQRARTGFKLPRRFEGGQSSLIQRLPKRRGFRSPYTKPVSVRIALVLKRIDTDRITLKALIGAGLLNAVEAKQQGAKLVGTAATLRPLRWGRGVTVTKALTARLQALKS